MQFTLEVKIDQDGDTILTKEVKIEDGVLVDLKPILLAACANLHILVNDFITKL